MKISILLKVIIIIFFLTTNFNLTAENLLSTDIESIINNNEYRLNPIVGWSNDGKLAYFYKFTPTEPIGSLYDFHIIDLITDKIIYSIELDHGSGIKIENIKHINNAIKINHIQIIRSKILNFPVKYKKDELNIYIKNKYVYIKYKILKKQKIIFTLKEEDLERFEIIGYAKHPFQNRIAVFYRMNSGSTYLEISEFESFISVIGCHLDINFE